jgi:hypothetical protein
MFKCTSRFISEVHPCTTVILIHLSESGTQGLEALVMTIVKVFETVLGCFMTIPRAALLIALHLPPDSHTKTFRTWSAAGEQVTKLSIRFRIV